LDGWQVGANIPLAFAAGICFILFVDVDAVSVLGLFGVTLDVSLCRALAQNASAWLSASGCLAAVLDSSPRRCHFGFLSPPPLLCRLLFF